MKKSTGNQFVRKTLLSFVILITGTASVFSQIKVSGTVTDSKNDPLIGVTVLVSGSKTGTITDFDGKYSIQVPNNKASIVFSYIGYKTILKEVGNSTVINVVLEEDAKEMDEVVVVAYGTQQKSHLTGAIAKLKNDKLDEIPVANIDQALQGKMAGVSISNTNPEAGEVAKIRVRGMGSISARVDPLIVVDGFPISSSEGLSAVSMGDVESIEVLKDASSAALYGSRAAGGVILITTKSGNVKKPKYNFKMYTGIRNALKMPDMLTQKEVMQLYMDEANLRRMDPLVDGSTATMKYNMMTTGDQAAYLIEKYFADAPTDWVADALRPYGTNNNYQLSASGGDKNLKYYISGVYTGENGIMKNSSFDKYTFKAKVDADLSKKVSVGFNFSPSFSRKENPGIDLNNYGRYPTWLPIRHNEATAYLTGKAVGEYATQSDFNGTIISGEGLDGEIWNITGANPGGSSQQNPTSIRERTEIFTDDYRLQSNAYITIKLLKGLEFKSSNSAYLAYKEYNKKQKTSANTFGAPNQLDRLMNFSTDLLTENTLNYTKKIGNHEISALAGYTYQYSKSKFNKITATNFLDEDLLSYNMALSFIGETSSVSGSTSYYYPDILMSYLGRVNYAYKGKYLGSISMRADGSTKFANGRKWGNFPAGSFGWRASEEDFLKKLDWLSNLKIRLSMGLTGNNKIPNYAYANILYPNYYVTGTGTGTILSGLAPTGSTLGNNDITWEQTSETDLGIDIGLFNSRVNLTVDLYNAYTIRLLLQEPAMSITGHQMYWNNIGRVNNKGLEIELTTTNIDSKFFKWKTSANLSTNKNTLISYGSQDYVDTFGERNEVYRAIVGQPSIQFFGYKSAGVWTTFEEVAAAKAVTDINGVPFNYTKFAPIVGGLKVENTNGDNAINTDDRVVLGTPFPDFTWGITNTFNYKQFDLSFMFQGSQGGLLINGNINYNEQLRTNMAYVKNRYVSPNFPGDGKTVYGTTTNGGDLMLTDYCMEDASYATLRDLSLGYSLPAKISKKIGFSALRAYFSGQNLLYFMGSNYRGINPEARKESTNAADQDFSPNPQDSNNNPLRDGYQRGAFPLNRTFTIGLDLTF